MPIIDGWDPEGGERHTGAFPEQPKERIPTAGEVWGASMRSENELGALAAMDRREFEAIPGYSPFHDKDIEKDPLFVNNQSEFFGIQSPAESRAKLSALRRREEDQRVRDAAGGWGIVSDIAAGIFSPTSLLPGGSIARAGARGARAARSAASTGAAAAGGVAVQEGVLQAVQPGRTAEESLFGIAGGAILGGFLGAGASLLPRPRLNQIAAEIEGSIPAQTHVLTPSGERIDIPTPRAETPEVRLDAGGRTTPGARAADAPAVRADDLTIRPHNAEEFRVSVVSKIEDAVERGEAEVRLSRFEDVAAKIDETIEAKYSKVEDEVERARLIQSDDEIGVLRAQLDEVYQEIDQIAARTYERQRALEPDVRPEAANTNTAGGAGARAAGAAASQDNADSLLKQGWGGKSLAEATARTSPLMGLATATVNASRRAAAMLSDMAGMRTEGNVKGLPTMPGGSVETRTKVTQRQIGEWFDKEFHELYFDYYKEASGGGGVMRSMVTGFQRRVLGRDDVPLTTTEFSERAILGWRLEGGASEDIPQIKKAMKLYTEVEKKFQDMMIREGLADPEDFQNVKWAAEHVRRIINPSAVAANAPAVEQKIYENMIRDRDHKSMLQGDATQIKTTLDNLDELEGKLSGRLATTQRQGADVGARLDEMERVTRREGARVVSNEERLAEIDEEILEFQDRLNGARINKEFRAEDLKDMEKELKVLRRARDKMLKEGETPPPATPVGYERVPKGAMGVNPSRFIAYVTGNRGAPREPSFLDWIAENGGITDRGGEVKNAFGGKGYTYRKTVVDKTTGKKTTVSYPLIAPEGAKHAGADDWAVRYGEHVGRSDEEHDFMRLVYEAAGDKDWRPDAWKDTYSGEMRQRVEEYRASQEVRFEMERQGFSSSDKSDVIAFLKGDNPNDLIGRPRTMEEALDDLEQIPLDPVENYRGAEEAWGKQAKGVTTAERMVQAMRKRLSEKQEQGGRAKAKSDEAAVMARASRSRMEILADRFERSNAQSQAYDAELSRIAAERDVLRAQIEDVIERWEGDTTTSARRALAKRRELETERAKAIEAGTYGVIKSGKRAGETTGKKPARLASADSEVDEAFKRILKDEFDSDVEIRGRARDVVDNMRSSPSARLGYEWGSAASREARAAIAARNAGKFGDNEAQIKSLMERRLPLTDQELVDLGILENDMRTIVHAELMNIVPQVEMARMFDGDVSGSSAIREIKEEYGALVAQAKTQKERLALTAEQDRNIKDFEGMRDRIMGVYGLPADPNSLLYRAGTLAKQWNVMRSMGSVVFSMLPDTGGIVMRAGLGPTAEATHRAVKELSGKKDVVSKLGRQFAADLGYMSASYIGSRNASLTDLTTNYGRNSKFERASAAATDAFMTINMSRHYDHFVHTIASGAALRTIMRGVEEMATKGKSDLSEYLASNNIGLEQAQRIWREASSKPGFRDNDVWMPDGHTWNKEVYDEMRFAASQMVDSMVLRPGQEKHLIMDTQIGSIIGQFRSFIFAGHARITIAGLQQADANFISGLTTMTFFGMIGLLLGDIAREGKVKDRSIQDLFAESFDRSGTAALFMEANNTAEKTLGVGMRPLLGGQPAQRNINRTATDVILGPTAGLIESVRQAGSLVTKSPEDITRGQLSSARQALVGQNLLYFRYVVQKMQEGIESKLGIPPRKENESTAGEVTDWSPNAATVLGVAAGATAAVIGGRRAVSARAAAAPAAPQMPGPPPSTAPDGRTMPPALRARLVRDPATGRITGVTGDKDLAIKYDARGRFAGTEEVGR